MKITIYQNREVYKEESKIGNDSENKVETLEFEFPEEYEDFTKYIEFQIKGEKYTDIIENNKYEITRAIAKQGKIKTQVVLRKSIENDVLVFKSNVFELNVSKSINATENIPDEYPTWADNLTTLKQNLEKSEQERVTSEEARIEAETQREETFTQMEQSVEDAVKEIADKKADYNQNALEKANEYNELTEQKTNAFNSNTEIKTNNFNQNYTEKTTVFDTDVTTKMNEFNTNATNKTTEFNNNAKSKTETFNSIVEQKENELEDLAEEKINEYNQVSVELKAKVEQVQAENESLKAENKLIKEQIPGANASGNSIHVEDSGSLELEWKLRCEHYQKQTIQNDNLLILEDTTITINGITLTIKDGVITINETSTASTNIDFKIKKKLKAGTYWHMVQRSGSAPSGNVSFLVMKSGGSIASINGRGGAAFTLNEDTEVFYRIWTDKNNTISNVAYKCSISEGSDSKPWVQGIPDSPSIDYSSEIETVGSNINYFDENTVESKFLNSKTGKTSDNASWRCTDFIEILSKQYNFSWESDSSYFQATVCYYDKNKTFISGDEYGLWGIYSKTFEIPDGANYMKVAHSITVAGKPVIRDKIKLEIGNKRTLYSPFMCGSVEIDVVNKNFLNISNKLDGTLNGITTTTNVNGSIHISGTTTGSGALFKGARVKVGKLKAGTYSFSAKLTGKSGTTSANSTLYFRPSYNGKPYAEMHPYANGSVYNNNVTLSSKTEVWLEWYCNTSGISIDADLYVQIERATANTETEQHQSQTAIMPVQQKMLEGDYISDVEHHEWQKFIFDGVTNRLNQKTGTSANNLYYTSYISNLLAPTSNGVKIEICSNCFKSYTANQLYGQDLVGVAVTTGKSFSIGFGLESSIDTLDKANEKLKELYDAGTPIIIYYKLAEAIDLELTSEQKAIRDTKLYTYKNITNIDVSDELASIDVNYKKDPTTEHDDLQNQIDEIKQLISTTETSALLLDNLQKDVETEVE